MNNSDALRIVTWNVRCAKGRDGRRDLERVARVIRAQKPDVVALQELDRHRARSGHVNQPEALAEKLGMHVCFSPTVETDGDGSYGHALFSRDKPIAQAIVELPRFPTRERRTLIEFELEHHGRQVRFWSVHLGLLAPERFTQTKVILDRFRHGERTILVGDFNAGELQPTMWRLRQKFADAAPSGDATWPSVFPLRRLDYVLLAGNLHCNESRVLAGGDASFASDHLGLSALVQLTE